MLSFLVVNPTGAYVIRKERIKKAVKILIKGSVVHLSGTLCAIVVCPTEHYKIRKREVSVHYILKNIENKI